VLFEKLERPGDCLSNILTQFIRLLYQPTELCRAHVQIVKFVPVVDVSQRLGIVKIIFCHDTDSIDVAILFHQASKLINDSSCDHRTVSRLVSV
jgi:hypothetical protein